MLFAMTKCKGTDKKASAGGAPAAGAGALAPSDWAAITLMIASGIAAIAAVRVGSPMRAWTSVSLAWIPFMLAGLSLSAIPRSTIVRRVAVTVAIVMAMGPAVLSPPQFAGDAAEYYQMMTGFMDHATPDLRAVDSADFRRAASLQGLQAIGPRTNLASQYVASRSGALYSIHFWMSSLAAAVIAWPVRAVGGPWLRAFQLLNAAMLVTALLAIVLWSGFDETQTRLFAAFWTVSPVLFYVGWVSAEVICASLVVIAATMFSRGRYSASVLLVALAATQNPPLLLLAALLAGFGLLGSWPERGFKGALPITAAVLPAFLPDLFYLATYGTPNIIMKLDGAGLKFVSAGKIADVFLDLNQGILPYAPTLLILAVAAVGVVAWRRGWFGVGLFVVAVLMAALSAMAPNWNSGGVGLMRYATWELPVLLWLVVLAAKGAGRAAQVAFAGMVFVQFAIVFAASVNPLVAPSYLQTGYLAAWVLDNAPGLYAPEPQIFVERVMQSEGDWKAKLPVCYLTSGGQLRKVLLRRDQIGAVAKQVGMDASTLSSRAYPSRDPLLVYVDFPSWASGR